jgi:hypothetical protein
MKPIPPASRSLAAARAHLTEGATDIDAAVVAATRAAAPYQRPERGPAPADARVS